jgi:hypothetical protein
MLMAPRLLLAASAVDQIRLMQINQVRIEGLLNSLRLNHAVVNISK